MPGERFAAGTAAIGRKGTCDFAFARLGAFGLRLSFAVALAALARAPLAGFFDFPLLPVLDPVAMSLAKGKKPRGS